MKIMQLLRGALSASSSDATRPTDSKTTDAESPAATVQTRVAVNFQLDPRAVGGVQSNAVSLLTALHERSQERVDLFVYGVKGFLDGIADIVGKDRAAVFPNGQCSMAAPKDFSLDADLSTFAVSDPGFAGDRNATDALLRDRGVEVVHFPFQQYFATNVPSIYEPWDLQHRHLTEFFSEEDQRWRDHIYKTGCDQADLVITACDWTKRDLIDAFGIAPEKIAVVERGSILVEALRRGTIEPVAHPLVKADEPFLIYPALPYGHKNHLGLIQAIANLRDQHGLRIRLYCTGRTKGSHWGLIQEKLDELGLRDQIEFLGPVSNEELVWLYKNATGMIFPSMFEGLGIPIVEALICGLPTAAGDVTCVSDVVDGRAYLFDPHDIAEIEKAIRHLWETTPDRDALAESAAAMADRFSWARAAERFEVCYKATAGKALSAEEQALLNRLIGVEEPIG